MFYKLLGMAVWKLGTANLRRNYARQLQAAAVVGLLALIGAGYLATRSGD